MQNPYSRNLGIILSCSFFSHSTSTHPRDANFLFGSVYFVSEPSKKMGSELTGKFLQNEFFHWWTYISELRFRIYIQNPATMLIFSQNGLWSVPNKQNPTFYLIFHAFSRPKFPPVWPGPIPGPYQPFPGIIPPYRPSIPPTSSSQLGPPIFFRNFRPV